MTETEKSRKPSKIMGGKFKFDDGTEVILPEEKAGITTGTKKGRTVTIKDEPLAPAPLGVGPGYIHGF